MSAAKNHVCPVTSETEKLQHATDEQIRVEGGAGRRMKTKF